jgi:charged multivesicular body protein 3
MSLQRIFGRQLSTDEMVKKWRQSLRTQERALDKQIRGIEQEELKVKRSLKEAAKKGDKTICTMLAKEIVRSRKAKDRIHTSKAQLNSVGMQLQQQAAQLKIAGTLQKSTQIMKAVNRLAKLPEISQTMQEMQMEMMKAGIIEEMMDDALNVGEDEDEIEEEAEEEVNKVLMELTSGMLLGSGTVGQDLPQAAEDEVQVSDVEDEVKARLEALKS